MKACRECGLIQQIPAVPAGYRAVCARCHLPLNPTLRWGRSRQRTLAATIAALILYIPAVTLPMLEIRRLGHHHSSSLLSATWDMLNHGEWLVGVIVLLFSVILPLAKLGLLLEVSLWEFAPRHRRAATFRLMEQVSKWSMMDVLLVALLVMLIKLGDLVEFRIGPAVWAFGLCVALSMLASMSFDPHSIWEDA